MQKLVLIFVLIGLSSCTVNVTDQTKFYQGFNAAINFGVESGFVSQPHLEGTGNTFYQLVFKSGQYLNTANVNDPIVIWLNGGPGCASQFGLFSEIGPFIVTKRTNGYNIDLRTLSWNNQAHLLFVDQPFGAGFSYTNTKSNVNTTADAAKYFVEFLAQFVGAHSQLTNKIYIFGESFAGHYIPAITASLLSDARFQNANLQGVGIGDAWISPLSQLSTYGSYLYSTGLVDDLRRNTAQAISTSAQQAILKGDFLTGSKYFDQASGDILANFTGNTSPYNYQQYLVAGAPADVYEGFLNKYKEKFNAPNDYQGCNQSIYDNFQDIVTSREDDIIKILKSGLQVLIYNGQLDYIVNTPGALLWINQLKYDPISQWKQQKKTLFQVANVTKGWIKSYQNFAFVNIYAAGHMVPTDQPEAAYAMLQHYLKNDTVWQ